MRQFTWLKLLVTGAFATVAVGCVAVDDPYYQGGGYGYDYGNAYSTYPAYASYPAWQGPGYYYDGGYYRTNPGVAGAIFIRDRDDWRSRDNARRNDWERRRDQARRDAERRRDQDRREADRRRDDERRRAEQDRRNWNNSNNNNWNNRPYPGPGYNQNQNPEAQRDVNRSERILRQQERRQLNSPDPRVNRERAEIFERQRQQREAEQRKNQNPWGTGNSPGN